MTSILMKKATKYLLKSIILKGATVVKMAANIVHMALTKQKEEE